MTAFPRIKVTTKVARLYANLQLRNKTYDGNYIIWMTDLNSVPGATLAERVAYVGGAMLTPQEAKEERNGTAKSYARVYTPIYLDKNAEAEAATVEKTADDGVETPSHEEVEIPTVTTPGTPPPVYADDIVPGENGTEETADADNEDGSTDNDTDTTEETAAHEEVADNKKTK